MTQRSWLLDPGVILIILISVLVGVLAVDRQFLTYGVENDFLATFAPEAGRILEGSPLRMDFHPPLYAFTLAGARLFGGGWFSTGLLLSWIACVVVLVTNYLLFRGLLGSAAAVGALIGLGTSSVFLTYSAFASSDLYFLALYSASLLLAYRAAIHPTAVRWIVAGILIGLTVLARTNGFTLLVLWLTPWLASERRRSKVRDTLLMVVAVLFAIMVWVLYARSTGSPLMPEKTMASLAVNYFGEGKSIEEIQQQFGGLMSVLTHDPALMIKRYVLDLFALGNELLRANQLVGFPVHLLGLMGLPLLVIQRAGRLKTLLLLATLLQLLLVNLKTYESRFFLFLIPWLGVAAALVFVAVWSRLKHSYLRHACAAVTGLMLVGGLWQTVPAVQTVLHAQDVELGQAVEAARTLVGPGSSIVARNQHLPFHLGSEYVWLSGERTLDGLRARLWNLEANKRIRRWMRNEDGATAPLLLYIGSAERTVSPSSRWPFPPVVDLISESGPPRWLEMVAQGLSGPWELYQVHLPAGDEDQRVIKEAHGPERARISPGAGMLGVWGFELQPLDRYGVLFVTQPDGAVLSGLYRMGGPSSGTIEGVLSGDRLEVDLQDRFYGLVLSLDGRLDAQADELSGTWRLRLEGVGLPETGHWVARRLPPDEERIQKRFLPTVRR